MSQLWLQDRVSRGESIVTKVRTNDNLADAFTKYAESSILELHMRCSGLVINRGRHELAPENDVILVACKSIHAVNVACPELCTPKYLRPVSQVAP